jgi:hypothetical protein
MSEDRARHETQSHTKKIIIADRIRRLRDAIARHRQLAVSIDADLAKELLDLAAEMETQMIALEGALGDGAAAR